MRALLPFLSLIVGGVWQLFTGRASGTTARRNLDGRGSGL